MEEDYEPTIQYQRRVNSKIQDVIKKEVEKLLDAGLIYPISDSPWNLMLFSETKKGAENLVADHLSRLENPHQDILENKEITETFPLETLGSVALRAESTPWFADFANYYAGNFVVKGIILERIVGENRASWSDKLDDAPWAFCTAYKTPIGCTPFKLVYGKACHLPIELEHKAYWALKNANFDLQTADNYDAKDQNPLFNVGDQVLLFNSRLKIFFDKLKSRWSGPFTIVQVFPHGTVKLSQNSGPNFKVNGHRLKHYFGGFPGFFKPLVLFVLRSQELHNPQLHLGIPIS
ncbi:reverse transcriptase domain-containing protein [Tanacetum coccineum]